MFMSALTDGNDGLCLGCLSLLYVEDDPVVRHLLKHLLQRRVGKLLTACNGREGLELFREARPDLVVTDILMAEMDGLAMAESIRQTDPHVPIILLLEERLAHCLLRAKRHKISLALLFLDLDGFKAVNDRFGHDTGDALLKAVAVRLLLAVREQDTLARFGGDEFVLLLEDLPEAAGAGEVAQKIIRTLCEPFEIAGRSVEIGVSIGLSLFPDYGEEAETLLQRADLAMYQAKQPGGRRHCRYSADQRPVYLIPHIRTDAGRDL